MDGVTHVINLTGAGVADGRWTTARKKKIIDSRMQSTLLLQEMITKTKTVKTFIAGTAVGYYGSRGDEWLTEEHDPGTGFLADVVKLWEDSIDAQQLAREGVRVSIIRTGIVLATTGGALPKMILPLKGLISPYFGQGQQWYSWIHLQDICRIFLHCLQSSDCKGIYNGVAPQPSQQKNFAQALIKASNKPALLIPSPTFGIKLALGEMSATVLDSTRCTSSKIEQSGFEFQFAQLDEALEDLLD